MRLCLLLLFALLLLTTTVITTCYAHRDEHNNADLEPIQRLQTVPFVFDISPIWYAVLSHERRVYVGTVLEGGMLLVIDKHSSSTDKQNAKLLELSSLRNVTGSEGKGPFHGALKIKSTASKTYGYFWGSKTSMLVKVDLETATVVDALEAPTTEQEEQQQEDGSSRDNTNNATKQNPNPIHPVLENGTTSFTDCVQVADARILCATFPLNDVWSTLFLIDIGDNNSQKPMRILSIHDISRVVIVGDMALSMAVNSKRTALFLATQMALFKFDISAFLSYSSSDELEGKNNLVKLVKEKHDPNKAAFIFVKDLPKMHRFTKILAPSTGPGTGSLFVTGASEQGCRIFHFNGIDDDNEDDGTAAPLELPEADDKDRREKHFSAAAGTVHGKCALMDLKMSVNGLDGRYIYTSDPVEGHLLRYDIKQRKFSKDARNDDVFGKVEVKGTQLWGLAVERDAIYAASARRPTCITVFALNDEQPERHNSDL